MRPRLVAFSLALALCIAPASAQKLPTGMTMHRVQAGEPDAAGWMLAASTRGAFSVRLPLKFNDFMVEESDPKAAAHYLHTVGAKSQEGIKFSATRIVYRNGAESARSFFSRFEKGIGLGAKPEKVTPGAFAGRRSVDLVLRSGSSVAYQRAVLVDSDLVLMVLESPLQYDDVARGLVTPFFDSLVIR